MIDKVGAIILKNGKILVERKNNNKEECIIPGGKREKGESDLETLRRELKEELSVDLIEAHYIDSYNDVACFSNKPICVKTYLVKIEGEIICNNEIKEALWIDRNYKDKKIKLGSILEKYVIPYLIKNNLM